jgi:hypothetical protein
MSREGQGQGCISPDLPPEKVAMMFLGLVEPASILCLMSEGQFDAATYREGAWGIFRGMLSNSHRKPPGSSREAWRTKVPANVGRPGPRCKENEL